MSRSLSSRLFVFVCILAAFNGCGDEETKPQEPNVDRRPVGLFRARNIGRLHAQRETDEGHAAAKPYLKRAVELSKGAFIDRLNLARVLVLEGKELDAAEALLEAAEEALKERRGDRTAFFYLRGILSKRQKKKAQAVTDLREALRSHNGTHPQISYQLAYALETAEEYGNATGTYKQLLERVPRFRAAAYRLSRCLLRLKKTEEAKIAQATYARLPEEGQIPTEGCHLLSVALVPAQGNTMAAREAIEWEKVEANPKEVLLSRDNEGTVATRELIAASVATGALVADLDNDKTPDILLREVGEWRLARVSRDGLINWKMQLPRAFTNELIDAHFADMDHDGDLDIIGINKAGASILQNNGDQTWKQLKPFGHFTPTVGDRFDYHDIDGQNDLDVAFPHSQHGVVCYLNQRDGNFNPVEVKQAEGAQIVLLEDFNGDGATDLFAAGKDQWQVFLNTHPEGAAGRAEFQLLVSGVINGLGGATSSLVHDVDADGHTDIILGCGKGWLLLRNQGAGAFTSEPVTQTASAVADLAIHSTDALSTPLIRVATANGEVSFHRPRGEQYRAFWIAPIGRRDNLNSIGARIEIYDGTLRTSRLLKHVLGVRMGMGRSTSFSVDGVFVVWPQGIRQSVPADSLEDNQTFLRFKQKEGLVASCPFLYTLTEDGWRFITDVVGIAPLDEWLPEGATPALDPQEFVRLPQEALAIHDGRVTLSITEELRETTYLDEVELHWIDHDDNTEPWLNESTMQGQYDPLCPVWFTGSAVGPVSTKIVNPSGGMTDVSATVAANDGDYIHSYRPTLPQWSGWVERHEIHLTTTTDATHLLLNGRIAWYDSSISFAVSQMGKTWGPLQLYKVNEQGERTLLIKDMGVPAGMDRTIIAKLSDAPMAIGTELILSGQHRFLWDHIQTAALSPQAHGTPQFVKPDTSVLRIHGFSSVSGDAARHEQTYDFSSTAPDDSFDRAIGMATRLGDVNPLLQLHDDQLVVLVAGDRVDMTFSVPDIPQGQRRTYFLRITGWAKEGSFHNKTGRTIAPLPFRAMKTYPPKSSPSDDDGSRAEYKATYQTRRVTR